MSDFVLTDSDGTVRFRGSASGGSGPQYATTRVTHGQLLNLFDTPAVLVPGVAARIIFPLAVVGISEPGTGYTVASSVGLSVGTLTFGNDGALSLLQNDSGSVAYMYFQGGDVTTTVQALASNALTLTAGDANPEDGEFGITFTTVYLLLDPTSA